MDSFLSGKQFRPWGRARGSAQGPPRAGTDAAKESLRHPSIIYDTAPLNQGQASIRLLTINRDAEGRIHGFLETFDLGTRWAGIGYAGPVCPEYIALSYAWGETHLVQRMFLQNVEIMIRSNLYDALNAILDLQNRFNITPSDFSTSSDEPFFGTLGSDTSSTPIRHYWVDALCIDQANIAERNHQVGWMSAIYPKSALVISWLGPADEDLQAAMRYISGIKIRVTHTQSSLTVPIDEERRSAWPFRRKLRKSQNSIVLYERDVLRLCNLEYFRRMWILQEILLARENILLCGQEFICIPSMGMMDELKQKLHDPLGTRKWEDTPFWNLVTHKNLHRSAQRYSADMTISVWSFQLLQLVCRYGSQKCKDPRDRVFALLGIVGEPDIARRRIGSQNGLKIEADYACSPFELLLRIIALPSRKFPEQDFHLMLNALQLNPDMKIPCELIRIRRQGIWRQMITSSPLLQHVRSLDWSIVEQWPQRYEELNTIFVKTFDGPAFSLGNLRSRRRLYELQGEVQSAADTEVRRKIDEGPEMSLKHWARLTLGMSAFLEETF